MAILRKTMAKYKRYNRQDDTDTTTFWLIAGGLVASVVTGSLTMMLIPVIAVYSIYRTNDNMSKGKPFWNPGNTTRHLDSSTTRLIRNDYRGRYRVR